MHTGNRLHRAAIAQPQPLAVRMLELCLVGTAIVGQGDVPVFAQQPWHGTRPHDLVTQMARGVAVDVTQKRQRKRVVLRRRRDEFEQRLGIVRGDPWVGQLGAQGQRVGGLRQVAARVNPQALFLEPAGDAAQHFCLLARRKLFLCVATGELQHGRVSLMVSLDQAAGSMPAFLHCTQ